MRTDGGGDPRGTPSPFDADYEGLIAGIREAEDDSERLRAELAFLLYLLSWNYDLSPEHFGQLLLFPADSPDLAELQRAFREVALDHLRAACPDASDEAVVAGWFTRLSLRLSRIRFRRIVKSPT